MEKQQAKVADAFRKCLPASQTLPAARRNANATYEEVHEAQMTQLYELGKGWARSRR